MRSYTTTSGWLLTLLRALNDQGIDVHALLKSEELALQAIRSGTARIDMDIMTRIWTQARQITGDATLGLKVAQYVSPTTFSSLTAALYAVPDLATGLRTIARYANIFTDGGFWWARDTEETLELVVLRRRPVTNEVSDAVFAGILKILRDVSSPDLYPSHVSLARNKPRNTSAWHHTFGESITFHSDNTGFMRFPKTMLDAPLFGYDSVVFNHSVALMESQLKGVQRGPTTAFVRAHMLSQLGLGEITIETVASAMGLEIRGLQRRLADESQSFRRLLDEIREEAATRMLTESNLSVTDVSTRLGYRNQSSFTRACYRWYKKSPQSIRTSNQNP